MSTITNILPYLAAIPMVGLAQNSFSQKPIVKPNVVFIYADDIGFGDLRCNGASTSKSPNVD